MGVVEKLGYGVGDLASGLYLNFFGFFLFYFFVDLRGMAPAAIGLMLLLTKLVDAVTDPMMGVIADRTRSRWGRYRPYMLYGAIPFGFSGVLVFVDPGLGETGMLVWAYATYTLAMLAYTAVNVPYGGLLGVISPSARERASVTAYRMFFSASSAIVIGVLGTALVRWFGGDDEAAGIMWTMACIAGLSVFCLLAVFAATKERIPEPAHNGSIGGDLKVLVTTGPWIAVALAAILGVTAIASRQASALFFFEYVAGDDGSPMFLFLDRRALFLTALAFGQIAGVILASGLQRHIEKAHLIIFAGGLKAAGIIAFYFLPVDAAWAQTMVQLCVGIGFGILMVVAYAMFTDIAEYVDWRANKQMTALVVSASIFAVKAGIAFGLAIPGFVMGWTGFVAGQDQSDSAKFGIDLAFALIPAAALVPGMIAMLFYRIDRKALTQIESDLAERRLQTG
nr:glycoside-pentoside-hexuronide (GPH):cation symporter [Parerythrobacter lutipelagi]